MPSPIRKISTTEIAELAGVSTAAVSQWRRRHRGSFPQPLSSIGRSILFDRAEVLAWLENHGRPVTLVKSPYEALVGLVEPGEYSSTLRYFAAYASVETLDELPALVRERVERLLAQPGFSQAFEALTQDFDVAALLQESESPISLQMDRSGISSPESMNRLIAELAPSTPSRVLDLACGNGGTLQAVNARFPDAELFGNDLSDEALAQAQSRAISGKWEAHTHWENHDAFEPYALPADSFDFVCSAPPFSVPVAKDRLEMHSERWPYGVPGRNDDTKWLQVAHRCLKPGGVGVINVFKSALDPRNHGSALAPMLADGSILAVIGLPVYFLPTTAMPSALVVFTKNPRPVSESILFVEVPNAEEGKNRHVEDLDTEEVLRVYAEHMAGRTISPSATAVQVPRLEVVAARKPLLASYWVAAHNEPDAAELKSELTSAQSAIQPVSPVEEALAQLHFSAEERPATLPLSKFPGVKQIPRATSEVCLRGDIAVSPDWARVCVKDGEHPGSRGDSLIRCDSEVLDPWFLASIIDAVLRTPFAPHVSNFVRFDLQLVDVPTFNITQQRQLGTLYRELRQKQHAAEQQAKRWAELNKTVATAIASGAVTQDVEE
ncbi:MAG: N-6 DNA methylase [Corynebacterium flavescens]|uniref:N-6 DNA methylase n=1 Tax=Corynebacterium flavescens TaxID=28028 RepID=UPI002647C524|nr:N-6 DNA methylase [Corynebacterium flavescens]MDN6601036.1 N-6 DNA methylase [Corynebacterium flavescens]